MPVTSVNDRLRAIGMLQAGSSMRNVAVQFRVHRNTVSAWQAKYQQVNNVENLPRSGRPPVTNLQQDRAMRARHLRNRFVTAASTSRNAVPGVGLVAANTVLRRLRRFQIQPYRPAVRQILLPRHRAARLAWCRHHRRLNGQQWGNVLFSDESRFHLNGHDGRRRVFRRPGERYADACIAQRNGYPGPSVMVWGGITATVSEETTMKCKLQNPTFGLCFVTVKN